MEHTHSAFGHDPWSMRRGLVAAAKNCVRKTLFLSARADCGTEQDKPESRVGFNTTKAKPVLFFVFRSHNCRPYSIDIFNINSIM